MSANVNKVYLAGNLTRDVVLRRVPSGAAVAEFAVAVNERTKGGEERATFVDVVAWERQAETCAEYLRKGSPVLVEGRLTMESWEAKDGTKRTRLKVTAERVHFLSGSRGGEGRGGSKAEGGNGGREASAAAPVGAAASTSGGEQDDMPF